MNIQETIKAFIPQAKSYLSSFPRRSKKQRAIIADSYTLLETLAENANYITRLNTYEDMQAALLNGADSWQHYAFSGCGLGYSDDIREHYLPKKEWNKYTSHSLLELEGACLRRAAARVSNSWVHFITYGRVPKH